MLAMSIPDWSGEEASSNHPDWVGPPGVIPSVKSPETVEFDDFKSALIEVKGLRLHWPEHGQRHDSEQKCLKAVGFPGKHGLDMLA